MNHLNPTRYFNSCIQALKEHVGFEGFSSEKKEEFTTLTDSIPIQDEKLILHIFYEYSAEVLDEVMFRTDEIVKAKDRNDVDAHILENTATSNYVTTSNYILHSWGGFFPQHHIIIERISPVQYLYVQNDKKGIVTIQNETNDKKIKWFLNIDGYKYYFDKYPEPCPYGLPNIERVKKFVEGKYKPRKFPELFEEIKSALRTLYDFKFDDDLVMASLYVAESYVRHIIEAVFYLCIDATKGSGKTTLLEILMALSYHGMLLGDTNPAVIPRIVEEHAINGGVDELDEKIGESGAQDVVAVLRKGQRRGNPYIRCEGRNFIPKSYDVFGAHSFSIRSKSDDALMQRSFAIHTSSSADSKLPVLNLYKKQILKPLADELFLCFVENAHAIHNRHQNVSSCSKCSNVVTCSGTLQPSIAQKREDLYQNITSGISDKGLELLSKLAGRNAEITFVALTVAKLLEIDVVEQLDKVAVQKASDESVSESYHLEALENFLRDKHENIKTYPVHTKNDGIHSPCVFYPKNQAYQEYQTLLRSSGVSPVGVKRFHALLLDMGFVEGDSLMNVRFKGIPRMCLVFSKEIVARFLGDGISLVDWFKVNDRRGNFGEAEILFGKEAVEHCIAMGEVYEPERDWLKVLS